MAEGAAGTRAPPRNVPGAEAAVGRALAARVVLAPGRQGFPVAVDRA